MKTGNKKMLFFVSQTQTQWRFRKMEDLVELTASVLSHHYSFFILFFNPFFSVTSPSSFFFSFYAKLSLLIDPELSFSFLCGIREREQD